MQFVVISNGIQSNTVGIILPALDIYSSFSYTSLFLRTRGHVFPYTEDGICFLIVPNKRGYLCSICISTDMARNNCA